MDAERALAKLCKAAEGKETEVLVLLQRLVSNIIEHPEEAKFRRVNPENAKLKQGLFCHAGAEAFFVAAGFVKAADGSLELPAKEPKIIEAQSAVIRRQERLTARKQREEMADGSASVTSQYRATVAGGDPRAGHAELAAVLAQGAAGAEALRILERILLNVRRYPDSKQYKTVNLAKASAQKVVPALPLLRVAGFVDKKLEGGEDAMQLERMNIDKIERMWAMAWWTQQPAMTPELSSGLGAVNERALGAVIGACIGDALGAPLGGRGAYAVTAQELDKAFEMCGGGLWTTAPGQVTGNMELMVCHAEGLAAGCAAKARAFPADEMAVRYGRWGQSQSFYIEPACGRAFAGPTTGDDQQARAADQNPISISAGALVRSLPLAVMGAARNRPASVANSAREDARLSHGNMVVCHASAVYVVAAANLIASNGDRVAALVAVQEWAKAEKEGHTTQFATAQGPGPRGEAAPKDPKKDVKDSKTRMKEVQFNAVAFEELVGWMNEALSSDQELAFVDQTGRGLMANEPNSAKVALTHALRHLKNGSSFEDAMRGVLAGAGNCHMNAAAAGGLIGAAVGIRGIPERWVKAVLTSQSGSGQVRPQEYHPNQLIAHVRAIVAPP